MKLELAQTTTHYQVIGSGSPLVLLHGWGCDWQIWSPVISRLSQKYQLIIPDLPGMGSSQLSAPSWSSKEYVAWLHEFIPNVLGSKKYSLLGHSFGGKIAALHAASKPSRLQKLILVDAAGLPLDLTAKERVITTIANTLPDALKQMIPQSIINKALDILKTAGDYQTATPQQQAILKRIVREDISDQLGLITTPTLLIWGANDTATPISKAKIFNQMVKHSQLTVMPDAGHFPFVDDPNSFSTAIEEFLDE